MGRGKEFCAQNVLFFVSDKEFCVQNVLFFVSGKEFCVQNVLSIVCGKEFCVQNGSGSHLHIALTHDVVPSAAVSAVRMEMIRLISQRMKSRFESNAMMRVKG